MQKAKITSLQPEQLAQMSSLLKLSLAKPHRFLLKDIGDQLESFWIDELTDLLRSGGGKAFAAFENDKPVGLVIYDDLPWDSQVFSKRMGALRYVIVDPYLDERDEVVVSLIDSAVQYAESLGIEFLLSKIYADDMIAAHGLEKAAFRLMDTQLDYMYDSRRYPLHEINPPSLPSGTVIRPAQEGDAASLMEVARDAFQKHFGRFHADPNISSAKATGAYVEWIRSSLAGYADWIIVADVKGEIAGYSIWKKPSLSESKLDVVVGHYSIAAVRPGSGGRGLFGLLTYAGMEMLHELSHYILGPTHVNNYPVQRGYEKLHWQIFDARYSFHKWLNE